VDDRWFRLGVSLKLLFVLMSVAALLCASFNYAPTATLSVILLGPLPLLVFSVYRTNSRLFRIFALGVLGPFAAYAFFIGILFGPFAALAVAPEEVGFVEFRSTEMVDFLNWSYENAVVAPWMMLDPEFDLAASRKMLKLLTNYQADWMSLVGAELK